MNAQDDAGPIPTQVHPKWTQPPSGEAATYAARWKPLDGSWMGWAATCGKPGCPGFLGSLVLYDRHLFATTLNGMYELLREHAELAARTPEYVRTEAWWRDIHLVITHATAQPECLSSHDPDYRAWVLVPFRPQDPDGHRVWVGAREIYFGSADTGYRISPHGGGRRRKDGHRSGRRPVQGRSAHEQRRLSHLPEYAQLPFGESPTLPCTIWCRSCGSLNTLQLPDDAEELLIGCNAV